MWPASPNSVHLLDCSLLRTVLVSDPTRIDQTSRGAGDQNCQPCTCIRPKIAAMIVTSPTSTAAPIRSQSRGCSSDSGEPVVTVEFHPVDGVKRLEYPSIVKNNKRVIVAREVAQ